LAVAKMLTEPSAATPKGALNPLSSIWIAPLKCTVWARGPGAIAPAKTKRRPAANIDSPRPPNLLCPSSLSSSQIPHRLWWPLAALASMRDMRTENNRGGYTNGLCATTQKPCSATQILGDSWTVIRDRNYFENFGRVLRGYASGSVSIFSRLRETQFAEDNRAQGLKPALI
jgi:hypothetical protein